ncbi:hypothetical protein NUITMVRA1_04360 [Aerococcus viridans]|nr:hypothetical protein NUITMVRA1_04360 [Aerococcus viridans]
MESRYKNPLLEKVWTNHAKSTYVHGDEFVMIFMRRIRELKTVGSVKEIKNSLGAVIY